MSKRVKAIVSLTLTLFVLGSMLLVPATASGYTASIQVGKSSYLLGETVTFTGSVSFSGGEQADLQSVTLVISGPEPFTKQLPIQPGTYDYPADNLSVTVTWNNMNLLGLFGYGYGYGYGYSVQAGAGGGSINYQIEWRPPYMLSDPLAELPDVDLAWEVPDVTGLHATKKPQGVATDGTNLYLLVDGSSPDKIIKTDTDGNVLDSFDAPNKQTRAITYLGGYLYVYADNYQKIVPVTNETPTYDPWTGEYKLSIEPDWNKQVADVTGDGVVDTNDVTVTADGQPVSLNWLDINGRFQIDDSTIWDRQRVQGPTVVMDNGGVYHMWYYSDAGLGGMEQIGHATSLDGVNWTKDPANPVLTGDPGAWDASGVLHPSVVYDSATGIFHMWYIGYDGGRRQVGYATSTDGSTWVKHPNNPVFSWGATGSWEDYEIRDMDVIATSSYEMWYTAISSIDPTPQIGHAASADGVSWVRDPNNPVLVPDPMSWEENGVSSPSVVYDGTTYHMWYRGKDFGDQKRIGYATSPDGTNWTKHLTNPVLQPGMFEAFDEMYVDSPDVLIVGAQFVMWYEGGDWQGKAAIGRATSSNGTTWIKDNINNPVLQEGIKGATILVSYSYTEGWPQNSIVKIDPSDGSYVDHWQSPNGNQVGGLATDGTYLYATSSQWNELWQIDPSDGSVQETKWPWADQFPFNGGDALAYKNGKLYAGKGSDIFVIDWDNNTIIEKHDTILSGINGLSFIGNTLYIGASNVGTIYKSGLPGTVEKTAIGDYTARLKVVDGGVITSPPVSFTLTKLTVPVDVTITSPADGAAFFTPTITIQGNVNDPSIDFVQVGVELPSTELLSDDMEEGDSVTGDGEFAKQSVAGKGMGVTYSPDNLWHLSDRRSHSGDYAWAYNQEFNGQANYDTPGKANAGAIVSEEFTVGSDTELTFWTSWDTEPGPDWDRKLIEVWDGTKWNVIAQIVDGDWYWNPYPGAVQLVIPMAWMVGGPAGAPPPGVPGAWNWYEATLDLSAYAGQTVKIRFRFDTFDQWGNEMEGWYIDDVTVTGAGFKGKTVPVANLSFSTDFTLAEGYNEITVTAQSGYIPLPEGKDSETITVSLDTTAPVITLDPLPSYTNQGSVTISGTVHELNFDKLEITLNGKPVYTLKNVPTGEEPPDWSFSQPVALFEGTNNIVATVTDVPGLTGQDSATVIRDSTGPTITVLPTVYPTGEVSARTGDLLIFQVDVSDALSGVDKVTLLTPDGTEEEFMQASDMPEALLDQWGTTGDYIFPITLPAEAAPGSYSLTVNAYDRAGNVTTDTVSALVVSTLSAYNIYLMPDWNLISLPLIPDTSNIDTLLSGVPGVVAVWYYDAASGTWQVYSPGPAPDSLTTMETGKGYWVSMDENVFDYSAPLAPGLPQTPAPIKFSYTGQVLEPATVPPTYPVVQGWNLIGLHSERSKPVTQYLQPLTVPQQVWAALIEYQNYIKFELGDQGEKGGAEIYLGSFKTLLSTDNMEPGRGFWLNTVQPGYIVAQP